MTALIEKTVFISYRRTNLPWALAIYQELTHHGYDVFFDYQSIDSGNFEKVILENIKSRAHFLVILTPSALEKCKEPGDWLRREIETAMDEKRNIVPLMLESFDFGSPLVTQYLTGKLSTLNTYNGLRVYSEYFLDAMDRLRERYLNVTLTDIALPLINTETRAITKRLKLAASGAATVEKDQLTAQEWFERGYVFWEAQNFDEAIRCYTEGICLKADSPDVYYNRGIARQDKGDLDGAIKDYTQSIELKNPELHFPYDNRGTTRKDKGDLEGAIADYTNVIRLKPDFADAYFNRALLRERKNNYSKAIADYQKYLDLGGGVEYGNEEKVKGFIRNLKRRLNDK